MNFIKQTLFAAIVLIVIHQKINAQIFSASVKQFIEVQDSVVAITHVKIIDGTGQPSLNDQDIVLVKSRIKTIGPSGKISIPANAKIIDGTGKTIIPGADHVA